jgi:amino acid adenylation domain-containing protein
MSSSSTSMSSNSEGVVSSTHIVNCDSATEVSASSPAPDYWERYLTDAPPLDFPTDYPRPSVLPSDMGQESCRISEQLSQALQLFTRETSVSAASSVLAAFTILARRYSAQQKFTIAACKHGDELLPLVADFSDGPSFRVLAERLQTGLRNGEGAAAAPEDLQSRLGIEKDASRHPIFQVAFSACEMPSAPERLDLQLQFLGTELRLSFNKALFEHGTAVRMLEHLQRLLLGAIADSQRSCAELPMLSEPELHELIVERNDTARSFPVPQQCLHQLVEATAARVPGEIAVVHRQQQLSYTELNAKANQLAHYLRKHGVARNVRVAICLKRSLDFAVAILAVLKAGGTCVPLDPSYPNERLIFMLEDVAAPLVITEPELLQASLPQGTEVVCLSREREKLAGESRRNPFAGSNSADLAYVIYTSGSTGTPRGVLLKHAGLVNYTLAAAEMFELRPGDRMLQFCSISFDAALEEIFSTWAAGATLVFRRDDVSLEPAEMLAWMSSQRITVVDLPTAYWHEWVYALPALTDKIPAALRLVIVGGEKASAEAFSTWHKVMGNRVRWVNTYGPAEASIVALTYEPKLLPGADAPAVLPIGRPVANARVYLLDPDLNPVPVGVPGELHIGGIGVAQGYLNQPQLTQEKFVRDVFSDDPTMRMYKTGDLGRFNGGGEIEFVGRRDNQVKIRGFRIEPGEIESVLAMHSGVQQAAVVVRQDSPGTKRLVAYVVRDSGASATESEMRQHVQARLPEYMVPSEFIFLDAMPLTPNGKLNRRALSALKSKTPSSEENIATSDALHADLITIWEELLGRKPIGVRDNFFDLGGHSLLAARLMHRIRQLQGKTIPLAVLVQAPTIEKLADVLRNGWSHCWNSLVALQPEGSKAPFFCVHGVGGNVVGFHELARSMRPEHPFYALQSQGLDGQRSCLTSIEQMAAHYIEEIRTVQPTGPYHFGGFSLGGLVAYEMAQQLVARGEEVALVVLFDTYARSPKPVSLKDFVQHPAQLLKLPTEIRKKIRRTLLARRLPEVLKKVMRTNAQAAEHYHLKPYEGRAVLLRAGDALRTADDPYAEWNQLVAGLETIEIRGAHMDILREPQVAHLAERLKDAIAGSSLRHRELLTESVG